eukprot:gene17436-biopygen12368
MPATAAPRQRHGSATAAPRQRHGSATAAPRQRHGSWTDALRGRGWVSWSERARRAFGPRAHRAAKRAGCAVAPRAPALFPPLLRSPFTTSSALFHHVFGPLPTVSFRCRAAASGAARRCGRRGGAATVVVRVQARRTWIPPTSFYSAPPTRLGEPPGKLPGVGTCTAFLEIPDGSGVARLSDVPIDTTSNSYTASLTLAAFAQRVLVFAFGASLCSLTKKEMITVSLLPHRGAAVRLRRPHPDGEVHRARRRAEADGLLTRAGGRAAAGAAKRGGNPTAPPRPPALFFLLLVGARRAAAGARTRAESASLRVGAADSGRHRGQELGPSQESLTNIKSPGPEA